jgi:hypothetical protein
LISALRGRALAWVMGECEEEGEVHGSPVFPACILDFMLWEIGEFEFLLQALKFGIWDVDLVRGDRCRHYVYYVLLLYIGFRKGRKGTLKGENLDKRQ